MPEEKLKKKHDPAMTPGDVRLQEIYSHSGDKKDFPVVENVRQLFHINKLAVPPYNKDTKTGFRHPDYAYEYKWVDKNDVAQLVGYSPNAIWKPVTISNHSHIKDQGVIHPVYGTICYMDSVILCFTRREFKEGVQKTMINDHIKPGGQQEQKIRTHGTEKIVAMGGRGDIKTGNLEAVEDLKKRISLPKGSFKPMDKEE